MVRTGLKVVQRVGEGREEEERDNESVNAREIHIYIYKMDTGKLINFQEA